MHITVERPLSGGLLLSTIENNQYFKFGFFDYTVAEAKTHFKEYVRRNLKAN
jgi:hypothetical protein